MRVIAGTLKGHRLKSPSMATRPMTDRMKESLFSALGELKGLKVLDLYAGSGSLGLEAISRGAKKAIFVEKEREAIVKLEGNIEATKTGRKTDVWWSDVPSSIGRHSDERYDLVFLDPPYGHSATSVQQDLESIVMGGWLGDDGRIVVHRPAKDGRIRPLGLKLMWDREYGQSKVLVFTHEEEEE
jgi:16S rRNA (guanine966-N2)-methyltransferase